MDQQPTATTWQSPPPQPGPAPGVQFAPHGERLIAYIVDALIVAVLYIVAFVVLFAVLGVAYMSPSPSPAPSPESSGAFIGLVAVGFVLIFLLLFIIGIAYWPFFWVRSGQTPGMKLFNLWVVSDSDGGKIGVGKAILRLIGYWINGIVLYIGFAWILVDARRRGWHDLIAGTVVIKR